MLTLAPDPSPIVANEKISIDMRVVIGSLWLHSPIIFAVSTVCSVFTGGWRLDSPPLC